MGIADHQHIFHVHAHYFGSVLQGQRAGFLFGQAVAAEDQAEVVGQPQLFQ